MHDMPAIVMRSFGGPEVLEQRRIAIPEPAADSVIVRVRAFGLNHAEVYFRRGIWGDVAPVSGIECAGEVADPGASGLAVGQRVVALLGGMGRSINGSYAAYVRAPAHHVVPIAGELAWPALAALPESYATAWVLLHDNLACRAGQTLVIRGGTSALGQAAINLARQLDVRVLATTRSPDKRALLEALGAEPVLEAPQLAPTVRARLGGGADAVLDLVGTSTLLDSLAIARYGGRVAIAGFLGGGEPLAAFDPLRQLPSGVQLSLVASAFVFGTADVPLARIPFQQLADDAAAGRLRAAPAHVFAFADIVDAHRLMESGAARGKIVVLGPTLPD
jgi:NADPH:quinone reductase-like Zn-dependent oxidoreductase